MQVADVDENLRYSRRTVGGRSIDTSQWATPDEGALDDARRALYLARKQAVSLYLEGASAQTIRQLTSLGAKQAYRLIRERCLETHPDGQPYGWRGLVPWYRIRPYQRRTKIRVDRFGSGGAGALQTLLDHHPETAPGQSSGSLDQRSVIRSRAPSLSISPMTARPATTTTYFGDVDTAALTRLESSYDTTRLLAAVDIVDRIRIQLHDPEGLRDDLLAIHTMAHSVLNDAPSVPSRREGTFPEQVLDALYLIDEFASELTRVRTILEPLEALYPDDEFWEA